MTSDGQRHPRGTRTPGAVRQDTTTTERKHGKQVERTQSTWYTEQHPYGGRGDRRRHAAATRKLRRKHDLARRTSQPGPSFLPSGDTRTGRALLTPTTNGRRE